MYIHVRTVDATRKVKINIYKLSPVSELKKKLETHFGIKSENQRLFFGGKELKDKNYLFDYNIKQNDMVQIMEKITADNVPFKKSDKRETNANVVTEEPKPSTSGVTEEPKPSTSGVDRVKNDTSEESLLLLDTDDESLPLLDTDDEGLSLLDTDEENWPILYTDEDTEAERTSNLKASNKPSNKISSSRDEQGSSIEVIDLCDDEEDDIIWLPPPKEQPQQKIDDIEIVSSTFEARRPRLKFPKPKRQRENMYSRSVGTQVSMYSRSVGTQASLPMDPSPTPPIQHQPDHLYSEFESGCSRTDPVARNYPSHPILYNLSRQVEQNNVPPSVE